MSLKIKYMSGGVSGIFRKAILPVSLFTLIVSPVILNSCEDGDSIIGETIIDNTVDVIVDSTFTVTGQCVATSDQRSRTQLQMLGSIVADNYGVISSDFVTQMMSAVKLDTDIEIENIDSLMLVMTSAKGSFVGDSVVPLGFNVYELTKNLPSDISSGFDPKGYYDPSKPLASKAYNVAIMEGTASDYTSDILTFETKLPLELGIRLYKAYLENPNNFSNPSLFINNVFKGLYISNSFGSGRLTGMGATMLRLYYHDTYYDEDKGKDTTVVKVGNYFASAPEVISNNNIRYNPASELLKHIADGENLIVAPAGYEVKVRMPFDEIMKKYNENKKKYTLVNSLRFSVPAQRLENNLDIEPPTYLLLIRTDEKEEFFAKNKLPDNKTSFYATYDSTNGKYNFGDMSAYLEKLLENEDGIKPEDLDFTIMAVQIQFDEQTSYYGTYQVESAVIPWTAIPVMVKLKLDDARMIFTFSTQGK